jgi:hypothetical protein
MSRAGGPIKTNNNRLFMHPLLFIPAWAIFASDGEIALICFFFSPAAGESNSVMSAANFRVAVRGEAGGGR